MSSRNLEFVRSIYEAWERDDYSSTAWAHPDIEFVIGDGPDPGSSRGLAGMVEAWRAFLSNWEGYRFEAEEYRELDSEQVLVLIRIRGRGKASGLELRQMDARGATLFQICGGRVVRLALYLDPDRLLMDLDGTRIGLHRRSRCRRVTPLVSPGVSALDRRRRPADVRVKGTGLPSPRAPA